MKLMRSLRNGGTSWYYFVIGSLIAIVLINEWLVYYIQSWRWPPIPTDRRYRKTPEFLDTRNR